MRTRSCHQSRWSAAAVIDWNRLVVQILGRTAFSWSRPEWSSIEYEEPVGTYPGCAAIGCPLAVLGALVTQDGSPARRRRDVQDEFDLDFRLTDADRLCRRTTGRSTIQMGVAMYDQAVPRSSSLVRRRALPPPAGEVQAHGRSVQTVGPRRQIGQRRSRTYLPRLSACGDERNRRPRASGPRVEVTDGPSGSWWS